MPSAPIDATCPDAISDILGKPMFAPIAYADRHGALAEKLGFDASEIVKVTQHVPLCLRNSEHRESRKRLGILIAEGAGRVRRTTNEVLPSMISDLLTPGRHDVMSEFIDPFVNMVMTAMVGTSVRFQSDTMVSRLFSQSIGVSKRKRMNNELKSLNDQIRQQMPGLNETEIGDRVALCILGTDTLRGTFGCSLHDIFVRGASHDIDALTADFPPRTGVPYIDREALAPANVSGTEYHSGQTFRAWLSSLEDVQEQDARNHFFGFGAHTCLGRKISTEIWKMVTNNLESHPSSIRVLDYARRRDDVFNIPQTFDIEVTPCR